MRSVTHRRVVPDSRSSLIDRACFILEKAWANGLSEPSIDPEVLWDKAAKGSAPTAERNGRDSIDVQDFRERLEKLCSSISEEAELNALGKTIAHGQIVRIIRQRLALGQLWGNRPQILETKLAPPIIVVGQMRSGTTRVHRLLAADPANCATRFCDSWFPVPKAIDLRPILGRMSLAIARIMDPWIDELHPMGSQRPEEELGWLASALGHSTFDTQWRIPSFSRFCEGRNPDPVYNEFSRIMRSDAWHHKNYSKPRVLKVPQFSEELRSLTQQFSNARIVVAHRSHEEILKSTISLVANQMAIQSDGVDLDWIAEEWNRKLKLRQNRLEADLSSFDGYVTHAYFDKLNDDWVSEIRKIYSDLKIDLTSNALRQMKKEMEREDDRKHKSHGTQIKMFEKAA